MLAAFSQWLCLLPTTVAVLIAVFGAAGFSVACMFVTHYAIPHPLRSQHNDLAGFVLAIVGVIYAVLLAFIAVAVWQSYADVDSLVQTEANLVDDLYRDTISLPPDHRHSTAAGPLRLYRDRGAEGMAAHGSLHAAAISKDGGCSTVFTSPGRSSSRRTGRRSRRRQRCWDPDQAL